MISTGRRRPRLPTSVAALVVVLLAPWGAMLVGVRASVVENRLPRSLPTLQDGWKYFDGVDAYAVDRLPLRSQAVRADAWIDVNVFRSSPTAGQSSTSQVVVGTEGWLYLKDEITRHCAPASDPAAAKRNLAGLAASIAASGRTAAVVVAPDKSVIVPQFLPDVPLPCAGGDGDELWTLLRATPSVPGFIDMRRQLEAEQRRRRFPIYLRKDTHWTDLGALLLVKSLAEAVDPEVYVDRPFVRTGDRSYIGDLTVLLGLRDVDETPTFAVRGSDDVVVRRQARGKVASSQASTSSGFPLVGGKTLFLYDSFGEIALPEMERTFSDLRTVPLFDLTPALLAREVEAADTVLIEVAQREFAFHFGNRFDWPAVTSDLEARLEATSPSN